MSNVLMLLQFTLYRLYNENVFSHVRNWMIAYVSSYAAKFLLIVWLQKKLLPLGRYFSRLDILYICTDSFSLNSINMQMSRYAILDTHWNLHNFAWFLFSCQYLTIYIILTSLQKQLNIFLIVVNVYTLLLVKS